MEHTFISTNGLRLHVVQAGPVEGPLVILLHGFPEFWYGWRHQIAALAQAGYRVWVPDQRGYNLSDKPKGIAPYRIDNLAADVIGLLDAGGRKEATIVGHDWGAAVSWYLAMQYPERVSRLVILNVPHPAVMAQTLRKQPRQLLKSWYILAFQVPLLAEWALRFNDWQALRQSLRQSSRPGTFSNETLSRYQQAWAQPKALTSMINWYRAAIRKAKALRSSQTRVTVPTLILWGVHDQFLLREMAAESLGYCNNGRLVFFENATHWVHHEEAARVNEVLLDFFWQDQALQ